MPHFQKIFSDRDYCQGGSTVYSVSTPVNKQDRCQNSVSGEDLDSRFDDTKYYHKKTSNRAFSSAFGPAFG